MLGHCDVTDGATIDAVFAEAEKLWGGIDFVVHCIAFSDKDQLTGRYIDTTEDNFTKSLAISCYSFTAIAQRAEKLMPNGGSMLTLTYYGAEKWMPHYNVMGVAKAALEASVRYLAADLGEKNIRVNAISAGPIKTLAASGIGDFRYILRWNEYQLAAAAHGDDRGGRRKRRLSAVADVARRHRRDPACRRRLSCRRHEKPGCAGHFRRQGLRRPGRPTTFRSRSGEFAENSELTAIVAPANTLRPPVRCGNAGESGVGAKSWQRIGTANSFVG